MPIPRLILFLRHILQPGRGFKVVVELCFHYLPEGTLVEEVAEGLEVAVLDNDVGHFKLEMKR
jgi:hypothetical protein